MADSISVRGLTDEQVDALKRLVQLFRQQKTREIGKSTEKETSTKEDKASFSLGSRRSNVIGRLTREAIYEDR